MGGISSGENGGGSAKGRDGDNTSWVGVAEGVAVSVVAEAAIAVLCAGAAETAVIIITPATSLIP